MSDDLVKRLRNTPNWMREEYAHYKDGLKVFDRAPFEAAYALEAQAARIAELEAALDDALTYVWRAHGWSKLKPETQAYKFRKKDE